MRPPETAYPQRPSFLDRPVPADAAPEVAAHIKELHKLRIEPERYLAALRDWVAQGAASRHALAPEAVLARSRPRPVEEATATAHFALGQHLHRVGRPEAAVGHFRAAYRLHPDNWTYKRQAWNLLLAGQDPREVYGGDWLTDVRRIGAEQYYPALELE